MCVEEMCLKVLAVHLHAKVPKNLTERHQFVECYYITCDLYLISVTNNVHWHHEVQNKMKKMRTCTDSNITGGLQSQQVFFQWLKHQKYVRLLQLL